jgi:anti-sigma factor ChrR (cupin superfamily)
MALFNRLMGFTESDAKIPIHGFSATLGEFARGRITGAQAQTIIVHMSGAPLTAEEVTEAQTLLATISGAVTAKLARATEIDHVLLLSESRAPGYDTPALVKTRLGV